MATLLMLEFQFKIPYVISQNNNDNRASQMYNIVQIGIGYLYNNIFVNCIHSGITDTLYQSNGTSLV